MQDNEADELVPMEDATPEQIEQGTVSSYSEIINISNLTLSPTHAVLPLEL